MDIAIVFGMLCWYIAMLSAVSELKCIVLYSTTLLALVFLVVIGLVSYEEMRLRDVEQDMILQRLITLKMRYIERRVAQGRIAAVAA